MTELRVFGNRAYLPDRNGQYSIEELRPFFDPSAEEDNTQPKDAGLFKPLPPAGGGATLGYEYMPDRGFALMWDRIAGDGAKTTMISVGRTSQMTEFITKPNQAELPVGSFVTGAQTFQVIRDFAGEPDVLSAAVEWVDINSLPWPPP